VKLSTYKHDPANLEQQRPSETGGAHQTSEAGCGGGWPKHDEQRGLSRRTFSGRCVFTVFLKATEVVKVVDIKGMACGDSQTINSHELRHHCHDFQLAEKW